MQSEDEMRLDEGVRRDILQSLVVTSSSTNSLSSLGSPGCSHNESCDSGEERCPAATSAGDCVVNHYSHVLTTQVTTRRA